MLPRLEAERQMGNIQAMAAAFGAMKKTDQQRYLGRLRRMMEGASPRAKATPELLAAIGVEVVVKEKSDE